MNLLMAGVRVVGSLDKRSCWSPSAFLQLQLNLLWCFVPWGELHVQTGAAVWAWYLNSVLGFAPSKPGLGFGGTAIRSWGCCEYWCSWCGVCARWLWSVRFNVVLMNYNVFNDFNSPQVSVSWLLTITQTFDFRICLTNAVPVLVSVIAHLYLDVRVQRTTLIPHYW